MVQESGTPRIDVPMNEALSSGKEPLWEIARHRMGRRRFLGLMAAGGAGAVLAACGVQEPPGVTPTSTPVPEDRGSNAPTIFKNPDHFLVHDEKSWEARLENMQGLLTPSHLFFVRNNSVSLDLDAASWRLSVEGDAVENPLVLSYVDIRSLPARVLMCYLECGGNHRAMFDLVQGRSASGTQWRTGGVSNGEWVGASMRDVLAMAGIRDSAASVMLVGLDAESPEGGFPRVISAEKALHPDTLLAYALNGEPLPRDHGYPLRALVPGWVGSSSIKWLGRIVVSSQQQWTRNNTTSYVLIGDDYPPEGEAEGRVANTQTIKSALALPWPTNLSVGPNRIHGYAHSPHAPIARVEWSADDGTTWSDAELTGTQQQYSWARFELSWRATAGEHTIMTRATDTAGNTQPDSVPFNEKGYLFNQPLPHPFRAT